MQKQQDYILNTEEEYKQIDSVKEMIQEIHETGNFFHLSLKTLELIRRFNMIYIQVFEKKDDSPSLFNQLVILSHNLETQLLREN
ncbi:hypothetical protein NE848_11515 [Gramella jeungdoensis]|uniref:Uncharacterized protein n=1 Tax=Gramella jeungdoensis TaxID=708091 RepID=A0ABT0Z3M5_9FLAO|nr:hypothetical protein [Gramella jeungdoensis]MCM8570010.1 hypothetical protein [Gramella jeungdoensis]